MKMPRPLTGAAARLKARSRRSAAGRPLQTGALPWRRGAGGAIEILLVTSRDSPRWLPPKGWPMRGKSLAAAAAQEAYEEAGIEGEIAARPLGDFDHVKQHATMGPVELTVRLYPLEVSRELDDWPERKERSRRWFTPDEAAEIVGSEALGALIRRFAESHRKA